MICEAEPNYVVCYDRGKICCKEIDQGPYGPKSYCRLTRGHEGECDSGRRNLS